MTRGRAWPPGATAGRTRRPMLATLLALSMLGCTSPMLPTSTPPTPRALPALDRELAALVADPAHPVVSVSALALRDGQVVYRGQFGARHLGDARDPRPLPVTERTLFRVASISKLVVAVGVMRLVEQGVLRLDEDVSTALGWTLRHPQHPDRPITLRLLLSHRSGLSDGGESYFFDGDSALREVLQPGGRLYGRGANWQHDVAPGSRFQYVNLNFGVIATVMERATGERFDRLMQRLVLQPLGLRGGFDPSAFPPEDQADIATQYRKRTTDARERWDPAGPWIVQADDFRHDPPQPPAGLARYEVGRNGTLFGPQGRLRVSLADLGVLMQMLIDGGLHRGQRFLRAETVALLSSEQWRMNASRSNGVVDRDWALAWGLGVQRFTDTGAPGEHGGRGDRLVEGGGLGGWGHSGDAYGLMGMFVLDPERRRGLVVLITGPGVDPATHPSRWSAMVRWQEQALSAVWRHALQGS